MSQTFAFAKSFEADVDPIVAQLVPASENRTEVTSLKLAIRGPVHFKAFLLHTDMPLADVMGDFIWSMTDPKLPSEVVASVEPEFNGRSYQAKISCPSCSLRLESDTSLTLVVAFTEPSNGPTSIHAEGTVVNGWTPKRTKLNGAGPYVVTDSGTPKDGRTFNVSASIGRLARKAPLPRTTNAAKPSSKSKSMSKPRRPGFKKMAQKKKRATSSRAKKPKVTLRRYSATKKSSTSHPKKKSSSILRKKKATASKKPAAKKTASKKTASKKVPIKKTLKSVLFPDIGL